MKRTWWPVTPLAAVVLAALIVMVPQPTASQTPVATSEEPVELLPIPANASTVCDEGCSYTTVPAALEAEPSGATIVVDGGTHDGPIAITREVHLLGINDPVIDGHDQGTVVHISSPDVVIQGFTIQNSGSNLDREDSAIYIEAERVQVIGNHLLNVLFGVNTAKAHDGVIAGNTLVGKDIEMGVRGDGIKVWYSHRIRVIDNQMDRSRDLLIWYSNDVVVDRNTVTNGRYGFHFMNSDNGVIRQNRMTNNSVAIYLMYGKNFTISDNLIQGSRGPSGQGIGLKEIDGVTVEGNIIYDNRVGVFIDNSPLSPWAYNHFRNNVLAFNDLGLGLLPSTKNNVFSSNSMIDNLEQVSVLGGGAMGENQWSEDGVGNFWSDYTGYDADGDGIGDIAYRNEQLSEQIMATWPILQLFRFSLAEASVDFGSRAVPIIRQEPRMVDDHPLTSPRIPSDTPLPASTTNPARQTIVATALLAGAVATIWWGMGATRPKLPAPGSQTFPRIDAIAGRSDAA